MSICSRGDAGLALCAVLLWMSAVSCVDRPLGPDNSAGGTTSVDGGDGGSEPPLDGSIDATMPDRGATDFGADARGPSSFIGEPGGPGGIPVCARGDTPKRMPSPAYNIGAVSGLDDKIYLMAVGDSGQGTAAYTYEIVSATWTRIADVPKRLVDGSAPVRFGARIYVTASLLYAFDTTLGQWSKETSLTPYRVGMSSTLGLDGKIYSSGGVQLGSMNGTQLSFVYDPMNDAWSSLPDRPQLDGFVGTATGPNGAIYVIGEHTVVLDPSTQSWATLPDPPTPREEPAVLAIAGKIHSFGGRVPSALSASGANEVFDPQALTWSSRAPMPQPVNWPSAARGCDGQVYIFGGVDHAGKIVDLVQVYDPVTDSWQVSP